MLRRHLSDWHLLALLLVPLLVQPPRPADATAFNYMAHCQDLEAGRNSLFVHTVRQFQARLVAAYNRHSGRGPQPPPQGVNRLVRLFNRLRELRDSAADVGGLVDEVESLFLDRLEILESHCKRQIHG